MNREAALKDAGIKAEFQTPLKELLGGLKTVLDIKFELKSATNFRRGLRPVLANKLKELKNSVDKFFEDGIKLVRVSHGEDTQVACADAGGGWRRHGNRAGSVDQGRPGMKRHVWTTAAALAGVMAVYEPAQALTCSKGATSGDTTRRPAQGQYANQGKVDAPDDCATTGYMPKQKPKRKPKPTFEDEGDAEQDNPGRYR